MDKCRVLLYSLLILTLAASVQPWSVLAQQPTKQQFTAELETGLWRFTGGRFDASNVHFSPDRNYFVVYCDRGRVDINRPEDSLRFYRSADVEAFVDHPNQTQPPAPAWVVSISNEKEGENIEEVSYRWLPDSSGVAFLEAVGAGHHRLVLADLRNKKLIPLTSEDETVAPEGQFDIRDPSHYVYAAASLEAEQKVADADAQSPIVVGTGRFIQQLLLPENEEVKNSWSHRTYHLWAVSEGRKFEVMHDGVPLDAAENIALSPDGLSIAATLPVPEVPKTWEKLYPPPDPGSVMRIQAGRNTAQQYVRIELKTGSVHPLTDAPIGSASGWIAYSGPGWATPAWSNDGKAVLLADTFIKRNDDKPSRPCIAVLDFSAGTSTCVETLTGHSEAGHHSIWAIEFAPDGQHVIVRFGAGWLPTEGTEYRRLPDGSWQIERHIEGNQAIGNHGLEISIKQSINDPPLLVASKGKTSRVIWDPNPRLQSVELSEATVYTWKDNDGREVKGGLYRPVHYQQGQRYPLVIQTHGFIGTERFTPSGTGFPNEFAARQLTSVGFLVLQADDLAEGCAHSGSPGEGPCAASSYEAAAKQLVADDLADPDNIGLIGFSRSCWYVMDALTQTSYPFKAALIGDGVIYGYMQFMLDPSPKKTVSEIGSAPFGAGLQKWLKLSPSFNLGKTKTPLMVVAHGPTSIPDMWEPYAALYSMNKPVDLIMLKTSEHVITNPVERVASQTLSVDWFRFWLRGYEDPDPAKADQYKRWRELKKLQAENEKPAGSPTASN